MSITILQCIMILTFTSAIFCHTIKIENYKHKIKYHYITKEKLQLKISAKILIT